MNDVHRPGVRRFGTPLFAGSLAAGCAMVAAAGPVAGHDAALMPVEGIAALA